MSKPVSVMLVGLGGYGGTYVKHLLMDGMTADPQAEFVAGVDPAPHLCPYFDELQELQLPIYMDMASALEHHKPELVVISTPIHTHTTLCELALNTGASVLLEKPLCATLEEADAMLEAEERSNGFVAIGYQCRYAPATLALLEDVRSGVLGDLISQKTLALRPRNHIYYNRSAWAGKQIMESGVAVYDSPIMNACAHDLYFQLLIAGLFNDEDPVLTQSYLTRANDIENFDAGIVHYQCGDIKSMFIACHSIIGEESTESIYEFSNATLLIDRKHGTEAIFKNGERKNYGQMNAVSDKLMSSIQALRGGPLPPCRISDSRRHVMVIDQVQRLGSIVDIPEAQKRVTDGATWVEGMREEFTKCYEDWRLPVSA